MIFMNFLYSSVIFISFHPINKPFFLFAGLGQKTMSMLISSFTIALKMNDIHKIDNGFTTLTGRKFKKKPC